MLKFPTEIDKAYIAGFIDGDGSIVTHMNHGINVQPRVQIYQNYKPPLEFVQSFYGGKLYLCGQKGYWHLFFTAYDEVRKLLEDVTPYLRVKHRQAIIALIILQYKQKYKSECDGRRGMNSPYQLREMQLSMELSNLQAYPKRNGNYKKIYSSFPNS